MRRLSQERLAREEKGESARRQALRQELEWIRSSPKGRRAKSKARLRAFEDLVSRHRERRERGAEIRIPVPERLGDLVVEVEDLAKITHFAMLHGNPIILTPEQVAEFQHIYHTLYGQQS